MEHKSKSGTVFVDKRDLERWEELESDLIVNDNEFNLFTASQWKWLSNKVAPLINKARKGI